VNELQESLEWRSVTEAVSHINVRQALPLLDKRGIVAYTDGACIKNPGGPAGWAALLWATFDFIGGKVHPDATCLETSGHIPRAETTTNNRAEIAAVLAALYIAPSDLPLIIYSDSEYTIKIAQGIYQMKKNTDLWAKYQTLVARRKSAPNFEWVGGHRGHLHNERADELAGIAAWNGNVAAYLQWQGSTTPEAHNRLSSADLSALREQVQRLKTFTDMVPVDNPYVTASERQFINDMAKRLQKNNFVPTEKQTNWVKGLLGKYKI